MSLLVRRLPELPERLLRLCITVAELPRGSLNVNCTCRVGKVQSPAIKSYSVILLFRSSAKEKYPTLTGIHTINWVISKIIMMMSYGTRHY